LDYLTQINSLRIVHIEEVYVENSVVKTLFFSDKHCAEGHPGQFAMIWIPGFDEIPISISSNKPDGRVSVTIAKVGEATRRLHEKVKGSMIGVRGPFGNGFELVKGNVILVGGGTGAAPLTFLAEKLVKTKTEITFILGAKTKDELILVPRIQNILLPNSTLLVTTEDGSYGHTGIVTDLVEECFRGEKRFDMIYSCGREQMLWKISKLAERHKTPVQVCLERLIRCAIGLCGSCTIGKYRICNDGPVLTGKQLREVKDEFGHFKRDFNGRKINM